MYFLIFFNIKLHSRIIYNLSEVIFKKLLIIKDNIKWQSELH